MVPILRCGQGGEAGSCAAVKQLKRARFPQHWQYTRPRLSRLRPRAWSRHSSSHALCEQEVDHRQLATQPVELLREAHSCRAPNRTTMDFDQDNSDERDLKHCVRFLEAARYWPQHTWLRKAENLLAALTTQRRAGLRTTICGPRPSQWQDDHAAKGSTSLSGSSGHPALVQLQQKAKAKLRLPAVHPEVWIATPCW